MQKKTPKKPRAIIRWLNINQEKFCQLYVSSDAELFGNWTMSYIAAYWLDSLDTKDYNTAKVNASKLLTKTNIIKRINELLETGWFTDENVDKQTLFLINQFWDLKSKAKGIEIYNKLKKRGTDTEEVVKPIKVIFKKE
jgi:Terminase small subunit.